MHLTDGSQTRAKLFKKKKSNCIKEECQGTKTNVVNAVVLDEKV